jgi:hypothetical protein
MIESASKQGSRWNHCYLTYGWNMNTVITLKCFIACGAHKVFTIILHTLQLTQATSLPETKPKQFFHISCDQLTPSMGIILSIHALHLGRVVSIQMDRQQFKQDIPIKNNQQKLDFSQRDLIIIQSSQLVRSLFW